MGLLDRIFGRAKQSAGDPTGSASLHREGSHREAAGAAADDAAGHEAAVHEDDEIATGPHPAGGSEPPPA